MVSITYLVCNLLNGERGFLQMMYMKGILVEEKMKLDQLQGKRIILESKVKGLRESSIDIDLLDERVRSMLGYINKDEKVIYNINSLNL